MGKVLGYLSRKWPPFTINPFTSEAFGSSEKCNEHIRSECARRC